MTCPEKDRINLLDQFEKFKKEMKEVSEKVSELSEKINSSAIDIKEVKEKNGNTININIDNSIKLNPYDLIKVQIPIDNLINYIKDVVNNNEYINDLKEVFFEITYYSHENPDNHVIYIYQKNKEYNIYVYKQTERFEYIDQPRFFKFLNECFSENCVLHMSSMVNNERVVKAIPKEDLSKFKKLFYEYRNNIRKYDEKSNIIIRDFMLEYQHIVEDTYKNMLLNPTSKTETIFGNFTKNHMKLLKSN
jgi:hypothetical protein